MGKGLEAGVGLRGEAGIFLEGFNLIYGVFRVLTGIAHRNLGCLLESLRPYKIFIPVISTVGAEVKLVHNRP